MRYPEYEATQIARNKIIEFTDNDPDLKLPGIEYIEELERFSPFADKLAERAAYMGYADDLSDSKSLLDFLFEQLRKEPGIITGANEKRWKDNLRNWLKKGASAPILPSRRDDVYQLCFAFKMNEREAGEFFLKGYLERPFNYKDLKEAIYYFCLINELPYQKALELYRWAKDIPFSEDPYAETDTSVIGRAIYEIDKEEDFKAYIQQNRCSFESKSQSAKNTVKELFEVCKTAAQWYFKAYGQTAEKNEAEAERDDRVENHKPGDSVADDHFKLKPVQEVNIDSPEAVLQVIYGYYARETHVVEINGEKKSILNHKETIKKASRFPSLIRKHMVSDHMQLAKVLAGSASDTLMRSAIILFQFFCFFAHAKKENNEYSEGLFDEFVGETDTILLQCGYGQLYWRNPYDWMIGYCAHSWDPIDLLHGLIKIMYLKEPENEDTE